MRRLSEKLKKTRGQPRKDNTHFLASASKEVTLEKIAATISDNLSTCAFVIIQRLV